MWEFSLYFEKNLLPYFNQLKMQLKSHYAEHSNCVAIGIKSEEYVFMIALPKEYKEQTESFLKQKIAEIICTFYKPYYILNNLKNFDLSLDDNVLLLNILSSYENQKDIVQIAQNLNICDKLFLKSFVEFKLSEQKKKWKEIGTLINQNSIFLIDKNVKEELIKFLMAGLECQTDILDIFKQKNRFVIRDKRKKVIELKNIFYAKSQYDSLLYVIMSYFPKKIIIRNAKDFDVKFLDTLYCLFGENIQLLQ